MDESTRDLAELGIRLGQRGVHGEHGRLPQPIQEAEQVVAPSTAKQAVLVLDVDEVERTVIHELGSLVVRARHVTIDVPLDGWRIGIGPAWIVHGRNAPRRARVQPIDGRDEVTGEGGDATLARRIGTHERGARPASHEIKMRYRNPHTCTPVMLATTRRRAQQLRLLGRGDTGSKSRATGLRTAAAGTASLRIDCTLASSSTFTLRCSLGRESHKNNYR